MLQPSRASSKSKSAADSGGLLNEPLEKYKQSDKNDSINNSFFVVFFISWIFMWKDGIMKDKL